MTPKDQGYYMPAEWAEHQATWLSYPHNEDSWPGKIETIFPSYHIFIKTLAEAEDVHINVDDQKMQDIVTAALTAAGTDMKRIFFHQFPTNDAWCRDHGPAFLLNRQESGKHAMVNWNHNAWGGKYPYELDTQIPVRIYEYLSQQKIGVSLSALGLDFGQKLGEEAPRPAYSILTATPTSNRNRLRNICAATTVWRI